MVQEGVGLLGIVFVAFVVGFAVGIQGFFLGFA